MLGLWLPTSACAWGPALPSCPLDTRQMFIGDGARASCVQPDLVFQRADLAAGTAVFTAGQLLLRKPFPCQWVNISTFFIKVPSATGSPTAPCSRGISCGADPREGGLNAPSGLRWFQNPSQFCTLRVDLLRHSRSHVKLESLPWR